VVALVEAGAGAVGGADRRSDVRVPARFGVHCRRLGRSGVDEDVEVIDVSMGGMLIACGAELRTGDVVELTISEAGAPLTLSGLVVGHSAAGADRCSHVAFTRLAPTALERIGLLVDLEAGT